MYFNFFFSLFLVTPAIFSSIYLKKKNKKITMFKLYSNGRNLYTAMNLIEKNPHHIPNHILKQPVFELNFTSSYYVGNKLRFQKK